MIERLMLRLGFAPVANVAAAADALTAEVEHIERDLRKTQTALEQARQEVANLRGVCDSRTRVIGRLLEDIGAGRNA